MNAAIDLLNTVMDAVIGALAVALQATARAMLANVHTSEWATALVLAGAVWLLASRRGRPVVGMMLFSLAVGAGAWLSWRTNHHGMVAQQAVLAVMVLHGLLKAQGWALVKKF